MIDYKYYIEYKGFKGSVEYSIEDSCYHGKILDIGDLCLYEGMNFFDLGEDFMKTVDEYIGLRANLNMKEDK